MPGNASGQNDVFVADALVLLPGTRTVTLAADDSVAGIDFGVQLDVDLIERNELLPETEFSVGSDGLETMAVGDVDGDDIPDIVAGIGGRYPFHVAVLFGHGDGTFTSPDTADTYQTVHSVRSLALGYIDQGDTLDIVAVGWGAEDGQTVTVLLGNGDGTFVRQPPINAGLNLGAVALGYVDAGDTLDIVVANWGEFDPSIHDNGSVSILLNNGDGTFAEQPPIEVSLRPAAVALGQVDAGESLDIVVANSGLADEPFNGTVSVLLGDANGQFIGQPEIELTRRTNDVALGDLDRDGTLDLAVANEWGQNVSLLLGNGDGSFGQPGTVPASRPTALALGDLNGDQRVDMVVAHGGAYVEGQENALALWYGNGDGTFTDGSPLTVGYRPSSVALGDLDKNGSLDIGWCRSTFLVK